MNGLKAQSIVQKGRLSVLLIQTIILELLIESAAFSAGVPPAAD